MMRPEEVVISPFIFKATMMRASMQKKRSFTENTKANTLRIMTMTKAKIATEKKSLPKHGMKL